MTSAFEDQVTLEKAADKEYFCWRTDNVDPNCAPGRSPGMHLRMLDDDIEGVALNRKQKATLYRSTHGRDPCTLWVDESLGNLQGLVRLSQALDTECPLAS